MLLTLVNKKSNNVKSNVQVNILSLDHNKCTKDL